MKIAWYGKMKAKAYYNEFDPKAAAWLRELIKKGLIADGEVDERSITDVQANDLVGFRQCHFFAGIGGWSYALRLAGIPDEYPVWTGSCPCQPFSTAGKNKGKADERHLLPVFTKLIGEARPITVFGEQVEGAIKHGWLDDLCADMEREDYTVGATVLGAHSVKAPQIRLRLYWVAHPNSERLEGYGQFVKRTGKFTTWESLQKPDWKEFAADIQRFPDGLSRRVEQIKGFGNAIVTQVAAEFINSFYEVIGE